jgi:hypothetical protein
VTLVALLGLIGMQAVYWMITHPVNKVWLGGQRLGRAGAGFFSVASERPAPDGKTRDEEWTLLRDRWEYSHVARSALATLALTALVVATV